MCIYVLLIHISKLICRPNALSSDVLNLYGFCSPLSEMGENLVRDRKCSHILKASLSEHHRMLSDVYMQQCFGHSHAGASYPYLFLILVVVVVLQVV
jgi:hypothetical protein